MVIVIEKPDGRILIIFFKWNCKQKMKIELIAVIVLTEIEIGNEN